MTVANEGFFRRNNYTDEEREFLVAIREYKQKHQRPHPTWSEVLALFKSLGYRKVGNEPGQAQAECSDQTARHAQGPEQAPQTG